MFTGASPAGTRLQIARRPGRVNRAGGPGRKTLSRTHDVVVVGAGAAGLTAAGGLARLGLSVALIEAGAMGGECLNTGCVPSKALLAAAARAQAVREAGRYGIRAGEPEVDLPAVMAHVRGAIGRIAPHDAAERFENWGVEVVRAWARFTGPRSLTAGGRVLRAPRIVLAVGSRPRVPGIPGLADVPFLTNETVFGLDVLPRHLIVLGAGAVGVEMAQAFRRFGAAVTLVDAGPALPREEPEAAALVTEQLAAEGVALRTNLAITGAEVAGREGGTVITLSLASGEAITGSHLLVAAGRDANLVGLNLAAAGVGVGPEGIQVDVHLRTSARGIYAIGDCRAGPRLTHAAAQEGALLVARLGFGLPGRLDRRALPRAVYTDPELAQVGMTEAEARARGGRIAVSREPFAGNDRAVVEGAADGFVKLVRRNGRLVGACTVGAAAGETTLPWVAAIRGDRLTPWALSGMVLPYPTRGEIAKAAAFALYEGHLFSRPARAWARTLAFVRAGLR